MKKFRFTSPYYSKEEIRNRLVDMLKDCLILKKWWIICTNKSIPFDKFTETVLSVMDNPLKDETCQLIVDYQYLRTTNDVIMFIDKHPESIGVSLVSLELLFI